MDFFKIQSNIKFNEYDEEYYFTGDNEDSDGEYEFENDILLAIKDTCGFNDKQCEVIYAKAYQESHSSGFESICNDAKNLSYFIREIINLN